MIKSQVWWHMPVKKEDHEFKTSYIVRPCLKEQKRKRMVKDTLPFLVFRIICSIIS
jgi:hypothetical protein